MSQEEPKEKGHTPSSLGRLEIALRPGEGITLRIVHSDTEAVGSRFQIAQMVPHGEKYPNCSWEEQDDITPDKWFEGNTIAACLLKLAQEINDKRPLTAEQFKIIAYRIANEEMVTDIEMRKFEQKLKEVQTRPI